eukprot:TRINITY_DN29392_c0_g1_i5.p1 TRINITY_DN29392_c0_g1~~TRINITY_DN29392_c0_g1_i5.p1  ORF type:complete len:548 (-),score=76.15 TRINITY_DN29392_c0_g1_i5:225-1868(-)
MEIGGTGSGPSDTVVDIQDKITTPLISKVSLENESSHSQQAHNLIDDLSPIHTEGDFEESRVHLNRGQGGIASNPELLPSNKRSIQRQRSRRRSHMGFPGTGTFVYSKLRRSMDVAPQTFPSFTPTAGEEKPSTPGWCSPKSDLLAIADLFISSFLNILLVCIPLGIIADKLNWGPVCVFSLNFCGIIPLALMLGEVTEDLALRFGQVIGGLINATFGNVVELILSLVALQKGLFEVVQMSLLGSILSNMLLVLGCCFLFGGIYYHQQNFNQIANKVCNSLLFLSVIALVIPSALSFAQENSTTEQHRELEILYLSRGVAVLLAIIYICYLTFQLGTHNDLFSEEEGDHKHKSNNNNNNNDSNQNVDNDQENKKLSDSFKSSKRTESKEEAEDIPQFSLLAATFLLAAISVLVAVASEYLTDAINDLGTTSGVSQKFLSIIILPIAGNACEHLTAVIVAMKNKMDLSLGVAIGSSIQIAIFVIPVVVLVGWGTGKDMTLQFDTLGVISLTIAVIHANFITLDGVSNWLMGLELISTFLIIAFAFWFR